MKRFGVRCHATVHFNNGKRMSYSLQKQMAVTSYFLKKRRKRFLFPLPSGEASLL